jgi:hypothetical protein
MLIVLGAAYVTVVVLGVVIVQEVLAWANPDEPDEPEAVLEPDEPVDAMVIRHLRGTR